MISIIPETPQSQILTDCAILETPSTDLQVKQARLETMNKVRRRLLFTKEDNKENIPPENQLGMESKEVESKEEFPPAQKIITSPSKSPPMFWVGSAGRQRLVIQRPLPPPTLSACVELQSPASPTEISGCASSQCPNTVLSSQCCNCCSEPSWTRNGPQSRRSRLRRTEPWLQVPNRHAPELRQLICHQ